MALLKWVFEYRENEKRIDKFKERINEEFEKKDPNIPLTKNLRESMEGCKKKKIFISQDTFNIDLETPSFSSI